MLFTILFIYWYIYFRYYEHKEAKSGKMCPLFVGGSLFNRLGSLPGKCGRGKINLFLKSLTKDSILGLKDMEKASGLIDTLLADKVLVVWFALYFLYRLS